MEADTDTEPGVQAFFHQRLMARSGIERLRMACDMFDTATELIVASLSADVVGDPTERRVAILRRLYGPERDDPIVVRAADAIRGVSLQSDR